MTLQNPWLLPPHTDRKMPLTNSARAKTLALLARTPVCLLAFGFFLAGPSAQAQQNPCQTMNISSGRLVPRVRKFSQVTPQIYRGGQPDDNGLQQLKCLGIQIVVNLRHANESAQPAEGDTVKKLGMEYVSIPSGCRNPQDENVAQFLRLVQEHPDKKIFVHCEFGIDRTGLMIAAYRIAEEGWSQRRALAEMRANGFNWMHQHAWCPETYHYEQQFPKRLQNDSPLQALVPAKQPPAPAH
jgi:protein tyrosine phosphatase (PTP) superfamily phosphohydrolase (DUF442 family)